MPSYNQFVYDTLFEEQKVPDLLAGCVAHFRPTEKWKGEFGFDWIRLGDGNDNTNSLGDTNTFGDEHYAKIMGRYETGTGSICDNTNGWTTMLDGTACNYVHDEISYGNLINEYFNFSFNIPWKAPNPSITPNVGWIGEMDKTEYTYHVPIMTIRKDQLVKLKLHVELQKNNTAPKKIKVIQFEPYRDPGTHMTITDKKVKPKDGIYDISINCTKIFSELQVIVAVAVYDDPNGGEIEKVCGLLRVIPNSIEAEANIVIVKVKMDIGNGEKKGKYKNAEVKRIKEILNAIYTNVIFEPDITMPFTLPQNLPISTTNNPKFIEHYDDQRAYILPNALEQTFNQLANANNFTNHTKIFVIEDYYAYPNGSSWFGYQVPNTRNIVLFLGRDNGTLCHEYLHTLELMHTFNHRNGVQNAQRALYTYEAKKTENIMDYSSKTWSTWFWQWLIIWEVLGVDIEHKPNWNLWTLPFDYEAMKQMYENLA